MKKTDENTIQEVSVQKLILTFAKEVTPLTAIIAAFMYVIFVIVPHTIEGYDRRINDLNARHVMEIRSISSEHEGKLLAQEASHRQEISSMIRSNNSERDRSMKEFRECLSEIANSVKIMAVKLEKIEQKLPN